MALGGWKLKPALAVLFAEEPCQLLYIVAVVAVLGELDGILAL